MNFLDQACRNNLNNKLNNNLNRKKRLNKILIMIGLISSQKRLKNVIQKNLNIISMIINKLKMIIRIHSKNLIATIKIIMISLIKEITRITKIKLIRMKKQI